VRRASAAAALGAAAILAAAYAAARAQASPPQTSHEPESASAAAPPARRETPAPFYRKYLVTGDPLDDQIAEQEKRIQERPDDASLRNDFGNLLARRHFAKEAAEQYELAAKLDKHNFIAYYNLGLLRETEGKRGAAISAYEKSIKRKPGFPPSRFRLGRLFEQEGRESDAIVQYAQAFRIDPAMRDPHRNPLVIDSELIYRASLENYQRDIASTVESGDALYADESRFRAVPVDRSVAAEEVETQEPADAAPREVGPAGAPQTGGRHTRPAPTGETGGSMVGGPQPRPTARSNRIGRPAPPPRPTPALEVAPPPDVEQPPQAEPGQDQQAPETMPEPTPAPSDDVEPS
jgi:tetratricopeptide (TPR) repeat protein